MEKKYSINWEDDQITSIEVDGVRYDSPDEIPDPADRAAVARLLAKASPETDEAVFDKEFAEEFERMQGQAARFPLVIAAIFLAVALILLAIAAVSTLNTQRALAREQTADGLVVELTTRPDENGRAFSYPVVEFYLPDERLQRVQLAEGSWPPAYAEGQEVTVLYNPEQPLSARIASTGSTLLQWIVPLITGVLGIAFVGAAGLAWWMGRTEDVKRKA